MRALRTAQTTRIFMELLPRMTYYSSPKKSALSSTVWIRKLARWYTVNPAMQALSNTTRIVCRFIGLECDHFTDKFGCDFPATLGSANHSSIAHFRDQLWASVASAALDFQVAFASSRRSFPWLPKQVGTYDRGILGRKLVKSEQSPSGEKEVGFGHGHDSNDSDDQHLRSHRRRCTHRESSGFSVTYCPQPAIRVRLTIF
jgi:hypothetical protein